jgi:ATP-dependent DNA helicase RecG
MDSQVGSLVKVTVPPGLPNVYSYKGGYFERIEQETRPIPARRLRGLLIEKGVVQFETKVPPNAELSDLDPDQVAYYLKALNLSSFDGYQDVLLQRGCLVKSDGELKPTYAGILNLGRHPQQWLPSATILAARFPGVAISDQFIKQEIRGTLLEQIRAAEAFVRDQLRSVVRLVGLSRQETLEYPLEAIREILVNAVAHRDYNLQGDNIHIQIFADRLEIRSPGRLPGPINLDNLLVSRFSRNAVITQVLSDLGFVERLGYGLNRTVTILRQFGMPDPAFEEVSGSFRVTLHNSLPVGQKKPIVRDLSEYQDIDLNNRQQNALGYVFTHQRITNRAYQEICPEMSSETLRRDLADLVKKGVLIKVGHKKGTYYILKK